MWWRDISALCREEWFATHVRRSVGNEENTFFWSDVWYGGEEFRVRFNRLYDLSLFKGASVSDMCHLGWGWTVRLGDGGGGCLLGRRGCWGISYHCFRM